MPENLGGVGSDVQKTANIRPFNSPGTDPPLGLLAPRISLPSGIGVNLPSGTNAPGASSVPFLVTGTPGAALTYTFTQSSSTVAGSGAISAVGSFGGVADLSGFADGTIALTVTMTAGGKTTTLASTLGKNSVAPPAPTVSAAAFANIATSPAFNVTVMGQPGSIANVVIGDGALPVADYANGMDFVDASGKVTIPVYVVSLLDGPITISVTLTNGAGDSSATTLTVMKDTVPPALSISTPSYVNLSSVACFPITSYGEQGATASYTITDGTTTLSSKQFAFPASGKWNANPNLSVLRNGPLTITETEVDPAGNPTVVTASFYKWTVVPPAPTSVTLNPLDDSGVSASDYVTNVVSPRFDVAVAAGETASVFVNGVLYTGQALASGSYTVTALATDQYGNVSPATTAPRTLVIDATPPSGSFTIAGTAIGGQLATSNPTLSLSLAFTDGPSGLARMSFSTDGGATFTAPTAYAASASVALPGADGLYTVVVRVTDVASIALTRTVRRNQASTRSSSASPTSPATRSRSARRSASIRPARPSAPR